MGPLNRMVGLISGLRALRILFFLVGGEEGLEISQILNIGGGRVSEEEWR